MRGTLRYACIFCFAGMAFCFVGCSGAARRNPASSSESSTEEKDTDGQTAEEARRKTRQEYEAYLRQRKEEQERARQEQDRLDAENRKQAEARELRERQLAEENRQNAERSRAEQEAKALKDQATAQRERDRLETREAQKDEAIFLSHLDEWKRRAGQILQQDRDEQQQFQMDGTDFHKRAEKEAENRRAHIDQADPERGRFYRLDSERIFPGRLEISNSRGIRLFKNRRPLQFMAFSGSKGPTDLTPISLPESSKPMRFHLYEFLKGRPGNYVLLDPSGTPASVLQKGVRYRIVNIRSDGNVLLLVDLEREDLSEYHRISVEAVDLTFE